MKENVQTHRLSGWSISLLSLHSSPLPSLGILSLLIEQRQRLRRLRRLQENISFEQEEKGIKHSPTTTAVGLADFDSMAAESTESQ